MLWLTGWSGFLRRVILDWGGRVSSCRGCSGLGRLCCGGVAFATLLVVFRLADLSGAAGLGLGSAGSRHPQQEVQEASGGRCVLTGVVHPEALPSLRQRERMLQRT